MGRRLTAAALCVLVHGFVLTSPFIHAHPDDHDRDHHAGSEPAHHRTAVHAHLGGHGAGPGHTDGRAHGHTDGRPHGHADGPARGHTDGPAVEPEHERAIYLPLFVSEPLTAFDLPIAGPQAFARFQPDETAGYIAVSVAHGHDPPGRSSSPPRAPPVFPTFI